MRVVFTDQALEDLDGIHEYGLAEWGAARSGEFMVRLGESIYGLADSPYRGRSREAFHPGLRSILHRQYVVFYMIEGNDVVIGAVIHERRNHAALDFADRLEDG